MSNLTEKFAALDQANAIRHAELMAKLDTLAGTASLAKIYDEIVAMRGTGGPETTIRSINQSLWNLAGTAPGASLLQLLNEITAMRGTGGPETTIRSINQSLWNLAGTAPGASLLQLKTAIESLDSGISSVASNTSGVASNTSTLSATKDLIDRLLQQFDTAIVTPTMKDLLLLVKDGVDAIEANTGAIAADTGVIVTNTGTIATNTGEIAGNTGNPLNTLPPDCCAVPIVSTGNFFQDTTAIFITPVTIATWPETLGGDFTVDFDIIAAGYTTVHCANWTNYRIYVASKADSFGVIPGRGERYACNQWVTLSIPESGLLTGAEFNVDRGNSLKVYICDCDPGGSPPPTNPNERRNADPGTCTGVGAVYNARITDFVEGGTFLANGVEYTRYYVVPNVPGYIIPSSVPGVFGCDPSMPDVVTGDYSAGYFVHMCCSFDFTGNEVYPTWGEWMSDDPNDAIAYPLKPMSEKFLLEFAMPAWRNSYTQYLKQYGSIVFAAPTGLGMPANVFLTIR